VRMKFNERVKRRREGDMRGGDIMRRYEERGCECRRVEEPNRCVEGEEVRGEVGGTKKERKGEVVWGVR
jgi:hypothetical protein